MLWCVVYRQPLRDTPRLRWCKGRIPRGWMVGVQIVHYQHYPVFIWVVCIHQLRNLAYPVHLGPPIGNFHLVNGPRRLRRAVPRRWFLSRLVGSLRTLDVEQRAEVKGAVQELPSRVGIELSDWNWKAMRQYIEDRFSLALSWSGCLNYLRRLGFVLKRPQKRLVKADLVHREAFVAEYVAMTTFQLRRGHLGLGSSGGNGQSVPGNPCRSAGGSRRLLRRSGPPPGRSQATMSHGASGSRCGTDRHRPCQCFQPSKCRFHFGFSLGATVLLIIT